ncbi:MAG: hypothetical protein IT427_17860 [Pirellulales bacterium]|nr:hypothetical protein [Pirellulales bacterium]
MRVRMCSLLAFYAVLAASITKAADPNTIYIQVSDSNLPRLLANPVGSEEGLPEQDPAEITESPLDDDFASAYSADAESVQAYRAGAGSVDPPESSSIPLPKLQPALPANRSAASVQVNKLSQIRTHAQQHPTLSATLASYSTKFASPPSHPMPPREASSRISQSAAERYWREPKRSAPARSFSGALASARQAGPMGSSAPESVAPDSAMPSEHADLEWRDCDSSYGDFCGPQWSPCYNCGGWFGSVDYLLMRPTFSENAAYVRSTVQLDAQERLTETDTVVPRDFGYSSGLRTSLGYRFRDCDGELRFTYWNYDNCVNQATERAPSDGSEIFFGQLNTATQLPGQRLLVSNDLRFNLYDIEYAKCLSYGGCSPCDPCTCCQPWSLKYFAGVRIADIHRQDNGLLQNRDDSLASAWFINGDFVGAGPRVGLEGRRLFGDGRLSLFARTNLSLLLGGWKLGETRKTPAIDASVTENYFDSHTRLIPVAEIDLGGSYQISRNISLSAGYLFQAWWDLGAFEQIHGNVFSSPIDDSNIMGIDGLFARFEVCF